MFEEKVERIRFYLNYVEEHYDNVQKAWALIKEKCIYLNFVKDEKICSRIDREIKNHDYSKLTHDEFIPYQERHYPTEHEKGKSGRRDAFSKALTHHKENNTHHIECLIHMGKGLKGLSVEEIISCVHMIADWVAMGFKFGDTAYDFYAKIKNRHKLRDTVIDLIDQIFIKLYNKSIKPVSEDIF